MPWVRFLETPTEAEGGPDHPFLKDSVHELSRNSFARWYGMGYVEECDPPQPEVEEEPAPPPAGPDNRYSVRHVGKGRWGVYDGEARVTPMPMTRDEATAAMAAMINPPEEPAPVVEPEAEPAPVEDPQDETPPLQAADGEAVPAAADAEGESGDLPPAITADAPVSAAAPSGAPPAADAKPDAKTADPKAAK